jgi:hypothetical protein
LTHNKNSLGIEKIRKSRVENQGFYLEGVEEKNVSSAEPEGRLCEEKTNPNNKRFADVPNDMYLMDGFEGQCVVMVPSKNVVIVRLGLSQKREFDTNKFVSEVLGALSE